MAVIFPASAVPWRGPVICWRYTVVNSRTTSPAADCSGWKSESWLSPLNSTASTQPKNEERLAGQFVTVVFCSRATLPVTLLQSDTSEILRNISTAEVVEACCFLDHRRGGDFHIGPSTLFSRTIVRPRAPTAAC